MRRVGIFILWVLILASLAGALVFYAPQMITAAAERGIRKAFPGSTVSIGKCRLQPARELAFSDVEIRKEGVYVLSVKEIDIIYNVLSLVKGEIARVRLDGASAAADLRKSKTIELKKMIAPAGSGGYFRVRELDIAELSVDLRARGLDLEGTFSLKVLPEEKRLQEIDASIASLKAQGATVQECRVSGPISDTGADITIKKIKYNKAVITGITGKARVTGTVLSLDLLSASIFKGDVKGKVEISVVDGGFSVSLNCADMDLDTFTRDFKLEEKAEVTGKLKGEMFVSGTKTGVADIHGTFSTDAPGGVLVIKDTRFLENMAKQAKQPVEVLVENFKNYQYNIGVMKVSLDGGNLNLDIELEGDTGKRVLNVTLHDIFPNRSDK